MVSKRRIKGIEKRLNEIDGQSEYDEPDISIRSDFYNRYLRDIPIKPEEEEMFREEFNKNLKPVKRPPRMDKTVKEMEEYIKSADFPKNENKNRHFQILEEDE